MKALLFLWRESPQWARASSFIRFLDHTQRRITVGSTSPDEWSARRRDFYLSTHNTHKRQTWPRWDSNPNLSRRAAVDLRLRPRGHWDRNEGILGSSNPSSFVLPEWSSLWRDYAHLVPLDVTVTPVHSPYPSLRKAMQIVFFIVSRTTNS